MSAINLHSRANLADALDDRDDPDCTIIGRRSRGGV